MILVGLTGGIGSGKSSVSRLLAERGAIIIDADAIVHDLQRAGSPLLARMAERFGAGIVRPDGELDRAGLAAVVFGDDQALKDLNALVHPAVRDEMARRVDALRDTDHVVVLDVPLLDTRAYPGLHAVLVVDLDVDLAVDRLVRDRGMSPGDARARIANQKSRDERRAMATHVIDNSGDLTALERQVDELWPELVARVRASDRGDRSEPAESG